MRQRLLTLLAFLPFAAGAQTISTFESPALPKKDTFFMRYDMPRKDIGFNSGLAHFPLFADSAGGFAFWDHGFTYSSMTDSISGGLGNQYSARPGKAYADSQYAVAYGETNKVFLTGAAQGRGVQGFYITNSSYAWNSIKYGDFFSRKFGDTTGTKSGLPQGSMPDYFRLVVQGYRGGALKPDSVHFYLADYRSPDSTKDYIVKDWRWVSLLKLGAVDSLLFTLQSTDTASFGGFTYVNTPLYFCMDNFTTNETVGVRTSGIIVAKVYPNPVADMLFVELASAGDAAMLSLLDMSGRTVLSKAVSATKESLNMSGLSAGAYLLQLSNGSGQTAMQRIIKP